MSTAVALSRPPSYIHVTIEINNACAKLKKSYIFVESSWNSLFVLSSRVFCTSQPLQLQPFLALEFHVNALEHIKYSIDVITTSSQSHVSIWSFLVHNNYCVTLGHWSCDRQNGYAITSSTSFMHRYYNFMRPRTHGTTYCFEGYSTHIKARTKSCSSFFTKLSSLLGNPLMVMAPFSIS